MHKRVCRLILHTCLLASIVVPQLTAAAPAAASADSQLAPVKLTVAEAVELALQNNPTVTLQEFAVKEAELNLKAAQVNLRITVTPQQLEDAQAALEAAQAQLQLTRQAQALAVREQYIAVLKAQHTVRLANAAVEQAGRNLNLVRERLSVGLATDTDLYQAESALRRAQVTQRTAESGLESEQIKLNNLLARDLRAPFELVDDMRLEVPAWDLERDTKQALANRPDVQIARRSLELAQRNLKVADPSYTPQAQLQRLQMAVERAQIALDQATTKAILEVRQVILNLETARINVELANTALEQQRKQLQVAVLRHDSGLITAAELSDAQAAANVAEVQAIQALYDQALAVTRYENTIGVASAAGERK